MNIIVKRSHGGFWIAPPTAEADHSASETAHGWVKPQRRQDAKNSFFFNNNNLGDLRAFAFQFGVSKLNFQVSRAPGGAGPFRE